MSANSFLKQISARLRNIVTLGDLKKRYSDGRIQISTAFSKVLEGKEAFPYGFKAKAKKGKLLVLCQGGNFDAFEFLPVIDTDGGPSLNEGDAALYTTSGGWIVCRENGSVELMGKGYGGVIKVEELKTQLEKSNQILQALLTVVRGAPIPEPGNSSPSALQTALSSAFASLGVGNFSGIASDKVFHGSG